MSTRSSLRFCGSLGTAVGSFLVAALLVASPAEAVGQEEAPDRPEVDPGDVESPEAIVASAYDVISGPASEERDWDRFRSLLLPEGRLIRTGRTEGEASYSVQTVEEFIEWANATINSQEEGLWEQEIHAETERFGDIAHVFSTYELHVSQEAEPLARGINSFQLWYDGDRWWIVDIFWHDEWEGAPLPERYGG